MDFRHLRYFVAVAEELSFTRAAERLHIAQPALSIQIRALEEELGTPLLTRTKRKVGLTSAGQGFLLRARQLLEDAARARDEVASAARGARGRLRVAFTSSLPYSAVFSEVLRRYRDAYPGVDLQLREMFTNEQFEALADNALDIGLVRSPATHAPSGILLREIARDPVRIVMPTEHLLATAENVSMADLSEAGFITFPFGAGTGLPTLLVELARAEGFEPRVVQVASEATTQIALVAAGVGLALLPAQLEHVRLPGVCYKPLRDAHAGFPLSVAIVQGCEEPVVGGFLKVLDAVTASPRSESRGKR